MNSFHFYRNNLPKYHLRENCSIIGMNCDNVAVVSRWQCH